jgi:hypothetical protein
VTTYNTGATNSSDTSATVTLAIPAGVLVNDVMRMSLTSFNENATAPTITFSGAGGTWTLTTPLSTGSNPEVSSGGSIFSYGYTYERVATSGDIGATLTITGSGSGFSAATTWWAVAMASYTGAGSTDVAGSAANTGDTGTAPVTCPTETTGVSGDWAIFTGQGAPGTGTTWIAPSGSTVRQQIVSDVGVGAIIADSNGSVGASGTNIGGGTFSIAGAGVTWFTAFTLGLAPASAGATTQVATGHRLRRVPAWKNTLQFRPQGRSGSAATPSVNTESGPFNVTLPAPQTSLTGVIGHQGAFNITLPAPKTTLTGTITHQGSFSITLPAPKTNLSGVIGHQGSFNVTLPAPFTSLTGTITPPGHAGTFNITLPAPFTNLTGTITHQGPFSITLPAPKTNLAGVVVHKGSFSITLPAPKTTLSGIIAHQGPFNITLPGPKTTLSGTITHRGSFNLVLPGPQVSLTGVIAHKGSFSVLLPAPHTSLFAVVGGTLLPLVASLLDGSVTVPVYGGTVSIPSYAGIVTRGGPVLPVQSNITGQIVNNDVYSNFAITYAGAPLNLTNYTVKVILKGTRNNTDASGVTFTAGTGITITNAAGGLFTLAVPHADLPLPNMMWYRVDLIDLTSEVFTPLYGNFQVLAA